MSAPAALPPKCEETKLTIELIKEEDQDEVLALLKKFFFKDEPLNTFIKLGDCKDLENYSTKCIKEKCSFKALNDKNEIIGVLLNGIIRKETDSDEEPTKLADKCEHPKFKMIMSLMDHIDSQFNLFDVFPDITEFLDAKILSVDTGYRGLGIAGKLTDKTIEHMQAHNIKLIHVLCTSHFSARVMEKLDFQEVYRLPYVDYVVNGEQVFAPEKPHEAARILVKEI